ncbi:MAG: 5'/3'-nucleotidase SurE [Hyphomicrobiaceae bacterium]|nr:5'/3'-nucleotidase SurE [Hyphomicrobiaceae bacterium]
MRILVTNDDGINAPGLKVLTDIARAFTDDVWVVAPDTNQSGASHSLTLHEPLRCEPVAEKRYAVSGTPTDCVIMGVRHLMLDHPPDLVLSGVNKGANLAEDVTYSGTIAGAIEGSQLGVRSIAMSLAFGFDGSGTIHWETPLALGPGIIERLLASDWNPAVLMNVNFPDLAPEAIAGTMVTVQGKRDQNLLHIDERFDTWGTPYYWFGFERRKSNPLEGTDLWAIYKGLISITPLVPNLTHLAEMDALAALFAGER